MPDYKPLPHLPSVRRLTTGHDRNGKSIVQKDDLITPVAASSAHPNMGFTLVHRTDGFPVTNQGVDSEFAVENLQRSKWPMGIVCEVVDVPPQQSNEQPLLHRNCSLDYGVVLEGEITLILDDGMRQTLKRGDVFVQRGTMHAWENTADSVCRFMTVIVPAQEVVVEATGDTLQHTKMPGLTK